MTIDPHVSVRYHLASHPEQSKDITMINLLSDIIAWKACGALQEGEDVVESVDGCAAQYWSTPAWYTLSVVAHLTGCAIDRLKMITGHGRCTNDADGGDWRVAARS